MPSDEPSFWGQMRARVRISRAWLARGVARLVTVALVAGFAALVWRDRAPLAAPIAQSAAPTATIVSAETFAPDSTHTPTSGPATTTPVPFVCANAPGSQRMYAFLNHDRQIYRVTGCANPVRLTNYDEKSFASPLAFSPGNRWLMISVTQNVSDTSYPRNVRSSSIPRMAPRQRRRFAPMAEMSRGRSGQRSSLGSTTTPSWSR